MIKTWENLCRLTIHIDDPDDKLNFIEELTRQGLVDVAAVRFDFNIYINKKGVKLSNGSMIESNNGLLQKNEMVQIALTLLDTDFEKTKAAKILGITRATLYAKMKQYNIKDNKAALAITTGRNELPEALK